MDTVTLLRSAIRGLLRVCDPGLEGELRGLLGRDDDYRSAGKPVCDYGDCAAREALVDALAKDARALLGALDGRELADAVGQAAALLAAVAGQDLDEGSDGVFRIARRVAKDRVISTVDSEARHGHKTAARGFDGYKGHVAVDPDSELITATTVTAGNVGDARAADDLLAGDLPGREPQAAGQPAAALADDDEDDGDGDGDGRLAVYGDSAYGAGALLDTLEQADADIMCKRLQPARRRREPRPARDTRTTTHPRRMGRQQRMTPPQPLHTAADKPAHGPHDAARPPARATRPQTHPAPTPPASQPRRPRRPRASTDPQSTPVS